MPDMEGMPDNDIIGIEWNQNLSSPVLMHIDEYGSEVLKLTTDDFDNHPRADKTSGCNPNDSDYRDKSILQGMTKDNQSFSQAFSPGGAYIVLPYHLQHAGACHPGGDSGLGGGQSNSWQYQVLPGSSPYCRQPTQIEREQHH